MDKPIISLQELLEQAVAEASVFYPITLDDQLKITGDTIYFQTPSRRITQVINDESGWEFYSVASLLRLTKHEDKIELIIF